MSEFTKQEAIELLGLNVEIVKRWEEFFNLTDEHQAEYTQEEIDFIKRTPSDYLPLGQVCRVDFVEYRDGQILLTLVGLHDDNLRSFTKSDFENHCQILKSEPLSYAAAV